LVIVYFAPGAAGIKTIPEQLANFWHKCFSGVAGSAVQSVALGDSFADGRDSVKQREQLQDGVLDVGERIFLAAVQRKPAIIFSGVRRPGGASKAPRSLC
jgi:hypothetical protein